MVNRECDPGEEVFVEMEWRRKDGQVTFERSGMEGAPDWVQEADRRLRGRLAERLGAYAVEDRGRSTPAEAQPVAWRETVERLADGLYSKRHDARERGDKYDEGYFGAMLKDAESLLEAAPPSAPVWVPATTPPPLTDDPSAWRRESDPVLVRVGDEIMIASYIMYPDPDDGQPRWERDGPDGWELDNVSEWCPLPETGNPVSPPTEGKPDDPVAADNEKAADRACLAMIAQGYHWNGEAWARAEAPPSPYDRKRIAWELERTAMGDGYYGSALYAAKEFPEATPIVRSLLDRWATGKEWGLSDRTDLCAFALQIYAADGESPAAAQPVATERVLSCGCVLCVCDDPDQCHGCGAKGCAAFNSGAPCGNRATLAPPPSAPVEMDAHKATLASLVAAVSLLRRGGGSAAPSDAMFNTMLADYEKSIEASRDALAQQPTPVSPVEVEAALESLWRAVDKADRNMWGDVEQLRTAAGVLTRALAQQPAAVDGPYRLVDDVVTVNGMALDEVVRLGDRYAATIEKRGMPRAAQVFEALVLIGKHALAAQQGGA